jgi:hypothetical protein
MKTSASKDCKTQISAGYWLEVNFAGLTKEVAFW